MDPLAPMFWLCAATSAVAAGALSAFELTQRSHRGFRWWTGALWLNAAGAGAPSRRETRAEAPVAEPAAKVPNVGGAAV